MWLRLESVRCFTIKLPFVISQLARSNFYLSSFTTFLTSRIIKSSKWSFYCQAYETRARVVKVHARMHTRNESRGSFSAHNQKWIFKFAKQNRTKWSERDDEIGSAHLSLSSLFVVDRVALKMKFNLFLPTVTFANPGAASSNWKLHFFPSPLNSRHSHNTWRCRPTRLVELRIVICGISNPFRSPRGWMKYLRELQKLEVCLKVKAQLRLACFKLNREEL